MKKIITSLFFCCSTLLAFSQDQEEILHSKHLRPIQKNDYERGAIFKYDSIYRTDKKTFSASSFLARKDYFTYDKDGKELTNLALSSKDGIVFTPLNKYGTGYYANGTVKVDSTQTYVLATETWENLSKDNYLTYDVNGFPTIFVSESWDKLNKKWDISYKEETKSNQAGEIILRKYYNYDLTKKTYLLSSLDSTIVLDAQGNPSETVYYYITWSGNTPTYTAKWSYKQKFYASGKASEVTTYTVDATTKQLLKSDSSFYIYNAKNIYLGYQGFRWDDVTKKWANDSKNNYQVDTATDLYTSNKFEIWDKSQNAFYDSRVRKYFVSMLSATTDYALQQNFEISPNPTIANLNLTLNLDETSNIRVNVMNNLGQILYATEFRNIKDEKLTIPTQELEAGIYFLQIQIGEKQATKRFVKN